MDKILENLFFISSEPISRTQLIEILQLEMQQEIDELDATIARLAKEYQNRGLQLVEVAGGYQVVTQSSYAKWIKRLKTITPVRLSEEARVTLAIIAYKQPITRAAIEEIRGVDCESVLETLRSSELIHIVGDLSGAFLWCTTDRFLQTFHLKNLVDLPKLGSTF
ncbi:MAG: SMC-Scp complex subunit ScpB [Candidatus Manganitrophaceae bacterium]